MKQRKAKESEFPLPVHSVYDSWTRTPTTSVVELNFIGKRTAKSGCATQGKSPHWPGLAISKWGSIV
jgi:hypothetical protein